MKKILIILLIVGMMLTGCAGNGSTANSDKPAAEDALKVAALIPGPINDGGWNASCYEGLKLCEEELGAEIAYSENVPVSDFEQAFRDYASQGYDVIIGHGFEFGDPAKVVAKDFPDTTFIINAGAAVQEPNVLSFDASCLEAGFLGGVVGATLTKTGTVGIIGGLDIPPISQSIDGFNIGVKYANPKVTSLSTLTGSFEDVVKAKEIAQAYIEKGADLLMHSANQAGIGIIETCSDNDILAIGMVTDQSAIDPDTVVVSAFRSVPESIKYMVSLVRDKKAECKLYPLGIKEGIVGLSWNDKLSDKVTAEQKDYINSVVEDYKAGKIDLAALAK